MFGHFVCNGLGDLVCFVIFNEGLCNSRLKRVPLLLLFLLLNNTKLVESILDPAIDTFFEDCFWSLA